MAFDPKKYLLVIAGQEPPEAAALLLIDTLAGEDKSKWEQAEYEAAVRLLSAFGSKYLEKPLGIPSQKNTGETAEKYFNRIFSGARHSVKQQLASANHKIHLQAYQKQIDDALDIYKRDSPNLVLQS